MEDIREILRDRKGQAPIYTKSPTSLKLNDDNDNGKNERIKSRIG